ncbi:MAG: DUF4091 domain-containing protein [Clostridiales bacterium]|nr:DUF4091 domain-containing protein [Clostridiales bacterium]
MSIKIMLASALEKIFQNAPLPEMKSILCLLKGERGSLQCIIDSEENAELTVTVESKNSCRLYLVKDVPVGLAIYDNAVNCTVLNGGKSGDYPDLLVPFDGRVTAKAGSHTVIWAEFTGELAGASEAVFTVSGNKQTVTAKAAVTVANTELPEQKLRHMNWFHADCLATYYKTDVFSEEHWQIVENFMRNAASHGVNVSFTPLFTPPLDTEEGGERPTVQLVDVTKTGYTYAFGFEKLDRWIDTAARCGMKYYEFSHLFTQWGAKHAPKIMANTSVGYRRIFGWENDSLSQGYVSFLRQFGAALREYTDKKGITDRCYVHCSDEPGMGDIRRYRRASAVIHEYFGAYEHVDALSDFEFYKEGLIETPVPGEQAISKFYGNVPKLWTYYCCGQYRNELPNRLISFPSIRNRILGTLLYKFDCDGFLQWGYNFYYTPLSRRPLDPFKETDGGGEWPAGDPFVVYPGEGGNPLPSLRQKVFYDGIQDFSALCALQSKTSREHVLDVIKEELGDIDFSHYPMDDERFLRFRERIVREAM